MRVVFLLLHHHHHLVVVVVAVAFYSVFIFDLVVAVDLGRKGRRVVL
jgi:hypothetical protein